MKKFLKVLFIVLGILVGIILFDTAVSRIFKNSPVISFKNTLEDDDSYVYRGILIDTYYCTKETDIVTVSWHFKWDKFTCPIDNVEIGSERKQNLVNLLKDRLISEGFIDHSNLKIFNVTRISEYGYYNDIPEKKHMQFYFKYSCNDGTKECFNEKVGTVYDDYVSIWAYTDEKEIYALSSGISIHISDDYEFLGNEIG